jgi:hypothetical protein
MVGQDGVEGAMRALYRAGIWLSVDELKGRRHVVRGSTTIPVSHALLRGPQASGHFTVRTSGSGGLAAPLEVDLAAERDSAVNLFLSFYARGALEWEKGHCSVPGGSALNGLLKHAACGTPIRRWFCPIDPAAPGLHPRYLWSARALRMGGWMAGVPMPVPEQVPMDDPTPMVQWFHDTLRRGSTPHLRVAASRAVSICQAALDLGTDIAGAQFMLGGEPITAARRGIVERAGANVFVSYSSVDAGSMGNGCLAAEAPDDVHLYTHYQAIIQAGPPTSDGDLPPEALLVSTLSPHPYIPLINASLGDQATLVERQCGCPMEQFGWTTHAHNVRSFEKLTSGGMTFLSSHVLAALEESLPQRFGGAPTDYQLVEEESADGRPRLRLLVHPRLGPLDEAEVIRTFLNAVGRGSGVEHVMASLWRDAGFVRVERRAPETSTFGKIHHFRSVAARGSAPSPQASDP